MAVETHEREPRVSLEESQAVLAALSAMRDDGWWPAAAALAEPGGTQGASGWE